MITINQSVNMLLPFQCTYYMNLSFTLMGEEVQWRAKKWLWKRGKNSMPVLSSVGKKNKAEHTRTMKGKCIRTKWEQVDFWRKIKTMCFSLPNAVMILAVATFLPFKSYITGQSRITFFFSSFFFLLQFFRNQLISTLSVEFWPR